MQMQLMRPVLEDKAAAKKHWWPRYCNSMWKSVLIKITLFLWQYREKKSHTCISISVIVHALLYRIIRKSAYVAIERKS